MKRLLKRIMKSDAARRLACLLGSLYIRLVHATGRWKVVGDDAPSRLWDEGRPFVTAIWHGRMLMMPYAWKTPRQGHMLISEHRDGQLIAGTIAYFGFATIAGSTTRGGARALRGMLKALKDGEYVGVTPDGPRGPRMRASEGIVQVARMAGVPVVPVSFGARRGKVLGSWDRFLLPWPFSGGVILWGPPIEVPRDLDEAGLEAKRQEVETALNDVTRRADEATGRPAVEPAAEQWARPGEAAA